MIYTIRTASKSQTDSKGQGLLAEIKRTFKIKTINNLRTIKVFRLEGITEKEALLITKNVLFESIDQVMSFDKALITDVDKILEIAYKPGVMNPEAASILKAAKDLKINLKAADSSWEYAFYGKLSEKDLSLIIKRLLLNETIEQIVKTPPKTLIISGKAQKTKIIPIRKLSEKDLMDLSKKDLFLNLEEMKVIQNYFKKINRDPTDFEVEVIAQTWSEHCGHKTFKAKLIIDGVEKEPLIKRIKSTVSNNKSLVVSSFVDNSGVIDFYEGYALCAKVETHNSPSAIEPYGGAMTGAGGVFRDVLGTGQGAKVISATDVFCFAPWDLAEKDLPPGCLKPDFLFRKVVFGIRDYGNRVGIPTNNGSVHFHADFKAKPTVAAGAYGLIPKSKAIKKSPNKGDLILTIGGRTGRDGIHGATFSSGEMTQKTFETASSAVQIGNAIEEKRLIDTVLAMRDQNLIQSITDCGAGGYSSAIGEMGESVGAKVYLEKIPLKYSGLAPWEIFLSESQERMIVAVNRKNLKKVVVTCKLYNLEMAVIGEFTGDKKLKAFFKEEKVCDLQMEFIHNGLPQRTMIGTTTRRNAKNHLPIKPKDLSVPWKKILSHGNVASKESFVRMYDHNVQGTNALHPFSGKNYDGPNDGAVVKPLYGKPYGMVVSHGLNPVLNKLDPYWGSIWAITEAVSNFVAIGGNIKDAALIDNFIWPFPDEESLADLDKSVDACLEMAKLLSMPFISGKDSLSSTYRYPDGKILKIPPVLLISVFGKVPNVTKTVSSDFKKSNSVIVLLGNPDLENFGGSTYFDITNSQFNNPPRVDLKNLKTVLNSLTKAISKGVVMASHDISEGGIAAALSEMSFGGNVGAKIDLNKIASVREDFIFFSETAGTFLVEVKDEKTARDNFNGVPYHILGKTLNDSYISVYNKNHLVSKQNLKELKNAWQNPIAEVFK